MQRLKLIFNLARHEFRSSYYGSLFGPLWLILEPIVFASILWFFFVYAFKAVPPDGVPFAGWLLCGMSVWTFLSNQIAAAAGSYAANKSTCIEYNLNHFEYLIIKQLATIPIFSVFVVILAYIDWTTGSMSIFSYIYALFYVFCMCLIAFPIALILLVFGVFFRDMQSALGIVLQIIMWSSPIFWNPQTVPKTMVSFMEFNPMFYPITGLRHVIFETAPPSSEAMYKFALVVVGATILGGWCYSAGSKYFGDHA